ncbi:MAG: hypothetical protein AMXMBFR33_32290 [Candidatus Xenobia bacterium]
MDIQLSILNAVKKLQETERKSLGCLISELLAEALALRSCQGKGRRLSWYAQPMAARLDLNDKEALWAVLEQPE